MNFVGKRYKNSTVKENISLRKSVDNNYQISNARRRINFNFSVNVVTFGFKAKDFENLRRLYGEVLAVTAHARDV